MSTPTKPLTLSTCMIVRDEEDTLRNCLESMKEISSEIVIVDTGSKDKTIEIAKEYTDRIFHYKWRDNFGKARTFALNQCRGDWVFMIDSDEVLRQESIPYLKTLLTTKDFSWFILRHQEAKFGLCRKVEGSKLNKLKDLNKVYVSEWALLQTLKTHTGFTEEETPLILPYIVEIQRPISIKIYNYTDSGEMMTQHFHCRIIPNFKNHYYDGIIHEQIRVKGSPVQPPLLKVPEIAIDHYGYTKAKQEDKGKMVRNIRLLKEEIKRDRKNPFHRYNLQNVYFVNKQFRESLEEFKTIYKDKKRHYQHDNTLKPFIPHSFILAINAYLELLQTEEAENLSREVVKLSPENSNAWYCLAISCYKNHKLKEALLYVEKAFLYGKSLKDASMVDPACAGWKAHKIVAFVYYDIGLYDRAKYHCDLALKEAPEGAERKTVERLDRDLKQKMGTKNGITVIPT